LEIVLVDKGKSHIEVLVEDPSGNVLLEPLKEILLRDATVDIATYDSDHPMYGKKRLYVRVKSGKPQNAIKRAIKEMGGGYGDLRKLVEKAKSDKPAKATKADKPSKSTKTAKSTKATKSTKTAKTAKSTKAAKSTKTAKSAKSTKAAKSTKSK
jgi:DNA-directed RNA polymerase subunit L